MRAPGVDDRHRPRRGPAQPDDGDRGWWGGIDTGRDRDGLPNEMLVVPVTPTGPQPAVAAGPIEICEVDEIVVGLTERVPLSATRYTGG
jgi:hypothetical protein